MTTGIAAATAKNDTMATSTGNGADSTSKLAQNFDTFLTMLTTQLKHQDPLSPMDSTQFTNQLVQFSQVEQQIGMNTNLKTLISLQKTNQVSSAISYLGQTIEVASDQLPLQDGKASFSYQLGEDSGATAIVIKDAKGKTVKTIAGETTAGRHDYEWDGKDNNGKTLEDGRYSIEVVAGKPDGSEVATTSTVMGRVTDIAADPTSGTLVAMGGVVTTIDKILTIRDTASAAKAN